MKTSIIQKNKYKLISLLTILAIWQVLAKIYSPLVVPDIKGVLYALKDIFTSEKLLLEITITIKRLIVALSISIFIGTIIGLLIGFVRSIREILKPVIGLMQSVPPISWIVLAIIWFGLDGKASIFMVIVSTIPVMIINIVEGIRNIDQKLIEMGSLFTFSKVKVLRYIILPSIIPYFKSALKIVVGQGWKVIVMGEVLTTSNGIGGGLTNARLNIETDYVFAWTFIIVALFYITDKLISYMFNRDLLQRFISINKLKLQSGEFKILLRKIVGGRYGFKYRKFNEKI